MTCWVPLMIFTIAHLMMMRKPHHLIWIITGIFFALFLTLNLLRLYGFGFEIVDLGAFHQLIYNTANGDWWKSSINAPYHPDTHWLGFHFTVLPVLVASFFYLLFPAVETLSVIHLFSIAITAPILYHTCKALHVSSRTALIWSLVFLCNPFTIFTALFSFQGHSFALPFFAYGLYALLTKRIISLWICCVCILLCKEHFGLSVIGFAVAWYLLHKNAKQAVALGLLGAISLAVILMIIMPYFSPFDGHYMLNGKSVDTASMQRYMWIKQSIWDAIQSGFAILTSRENWIYYGWLLLPLLGLPLGGMLFILPAASDLIANVLSSSPLPKWLTFYHNSCVIPCLIIAACYGTRYLAKRSKNPDHHMWLRKAAPICLCIAIIASIGLIAKPLSGSVFLLGWENMHWANSDSFARLKSQLTPQQRLRVSHGLGPHLAQRRYITPLQSPSGQEDTVVLRLSLPTFKIQGIPFRSIDLNAIEREFINNGKWQLTYFDAPWAIFETRNKHASNTALNTDELLNHLAQIKQQYIHITHVYGNDQKPRQLDQ